MFLLLFLMVAAGMLSLLWIYFPMQGGPPQDSMPTRPPVTAPAPAAANAGDAPVPPGAPTASEDTPAASDARAATAVPGSSAAAAPVPGPSALPPLFAPAEPGVAGASNTPPGLLTVEELDRQLEKLLGNAPVSPPTRPPTRP